MVTSRILAAAVMVAATAGIGPAAFAQPAPAPSASAPAGQHRHGNAYMRALRSLDLSDAQKTQIRTLLVNARQNSQATTDPAARKADRERLRAQIDAVLTPEQRTKLQQTLASERKNPPSKT
jgi:Spy/CpxP family protein refolding chaperone